MMAIHFIHINIDTDSRELASQKVKIFLNDVQNNLIKSELRWFDWNEVNMDFSKETKYKIESHGVGEIINSSIWYDLYPLAPSYQNNIEEFNFILEKINNLRNNEFNNAIEEINLNDIKNINFKNDFTKMQNKTLFYINKINKIVNNYPWNQYSYFYSITHDTSNIKNINFNDSSGYDFLVPTNFHC
jgi:hypothetical protein